MAQMWAKMQSTNVGMRYCCGPKRRTNLPQCILLIQTINVASQNTFWFQPNGDSIGDDSERDDDTTVIDNTTTARDETTPAVDETTTSESSTPVDPCLLVQSFIDANFQTNLIDVDSVGELANFIDISYNITLIDQTAMGFLQLVESFPNVFGDFADALSNLTNQIDQIQVDANLQFPEILPNLTPDLTTTLNESCGIELSDAQLNSTTNFFNVTLPVSVFAQRGCALLNETLLEQAIFSQIITTRRLLGTLNSNAGPDTLFVGLGLLFDLFSINATDDAQLVAQRLFDVFVAAYNDFCGIPSLSPEALAALNDLLLRDATEIIDLL